LLRFVNLGRNASGLHKILIDRGFNL